MQTLSTRLDDLEQKVRLLLGKLDDIASENRVIKEENNQLKKELQEVSIKISAVDSVTESSQRIGEKELHRIKNELDNYIEEVEQCIGMLES